MSLESYWKLVSADAGERTRAAHDLVASLREEGAGSKPGAWDAQLPLNVDYAVKRLVRGLSSSTEAARQGFASCLAELLRALPAIPLRVVTEHMLASTEITGSVRGQEERDMLLGRLFTCLAVARSGRLEADGPAAWDAAGGELLALATGLFAKRKVLRSLAGQAVVALLAQMPPDVFTAHPAVERLGAALGRGGKGSGGSGAGGKDNVDGMEVNGGEGEEQQEDLPVEELNPDQLLVALVVQAYMREHGLLKQAPGALAGKLPGWLLASKRLLKAKRVPKLVEPLKASSAAFPRVHPVWDWLLDELLGAKDGDEDEDGDGDEAAFTALWAVVVDGALAKATHERKALCLMLLQRVAPRVSAAQLGGCLSPNVLKVLLAALSTAGTADQVLQPLAKQTLEALLALAAGDGERRLAVASGLLARCDVNFDMKTGTKAVQGLLEGLGPAELLAFVRQLARDYEAASGAAAAAAEAQALEEGEEDRAAAAATAVARQVWAVDALYALSKSPALVRGGEEGAAVVVQILRLLLALAYFDTAGLKAEGEAKEVGKKRASSRSKKGSVSAADGEAAAWVVAKPQGPVAKELRRVAGARLHSLLADLGKRGGGGGSGALRFGAGGGLGWLWALHQAWEGLEGRGAVLAAPLAEEARAARASMLALVGEIRARGEKEEDRMAAAFAALVMQVGLHQLRVPAAEEKEVEDDGVLGDLCRCYADLAAQQAAKQQKAKAKAAKGKGKGRKEAVEEEDVDPMAVLADVCVSALASASGRDGVAVRGLREVIRKAWGLVCGSCPLTRAAMDVLLGVVCKTPAGEGDGDGDGEESGSESEEEEDEEEDEEALAVLDRALQSAGVVNGNGNGGSSSSGSSSEGEASDEESVVVDGNDPAAFLAVLGGPAEGQAHLDSMLALKHASRQGSKTSRAEKERAELQLRLRALDLLEVAVAKQPQSPALLLAVRPCLRALRRLQAQGVGPGRPSEAADLAKRLGDFLEKRLVGKARPKLAGTGGEGAPLLPEEEVQALVAALLGDLRKAPTQAQTALLVSCLNLCTRAVLAAAAAAASSEGGAGQGTAPEWLAECYREALADFMTKRTALTAAPFEQLVARFPSAAALVLLPALPRLGAEADKAFRQAEAFRLVGLLLGQRKVLGPAAAAALQAALGEVLTGLAAVLAKGEGELTSKRLKPLVDCAQAVAQVLGDAGEHAAERAELAGVLGKVKAATASEAVQKQCASVARLLVGEEEEEEEEQGQQQQQEGASKKNTGAGKGKGKRKHAEVAKGKGQGQGQLSKEKGEQKASKQQKKGKGPKGVKA